MPSHSPGPGDLASLRNQLGKADESIAHLLAERMRLARQIIERSPATDAADLDRRCEEDLQRALRSVARDAGIDTEAVENVFRRIITESNRAPHAATSHQRQQTPRTIAIVGGTGKMGRFFARVFTEAGHRTLIADLDTETTPEQAAAQSDITLISVPIAVTESVIARVGPHVPEGALLMDVTSLKESPVESMLKHSRAEVVGVHPMFGPGVGNLRRQVVALCPARGERWADWLRTFLDDEGAEVIETTPRAHDKMMAIIQVLRHFSTIALGATLADLDTDIAETLRFTSPIYRLELLMIGRLFSQSAELYADIEIRNPHRCEVIDAFERSVARLSEMVRNGDREAFVNEFNRASDHFAGFKERAMDESAYLIECMIDRM